MGSFHFSEWYNNNNNHKNKKYLYNNATTTTVTTTTVTTCDHLNVERQICEDVVRNFAEGWNLVKEVSCQFVLNFLANGDGQF